MNDKQGLQAQIIIPTLNAEKNIISLLESIKIQKDVDIEVLVIDSDSNDMTKEIAKKYHCKIINIKRKEFNHGGTRQLGVDLCPNAEFIIFLTQDVILVNEFTIKNILQCFENDTVGCAYGRQLPHKNAGVLAAHARLFNYPTSNQMKNMENANKLGIKAVFISNSFAVYRRKALKEVGGFPLHTILGEDTYVAAKMLLKHWGNYYCAEAKVYHSHNYTLWQEFKRYFDIGVFHAKEDWIREFFGETEGEGRRFVLSEIKYVMKHNLLLLLPMIFRNVIKLIAYQLGINERIFHNKIKKKWSMNQLYWR